MVAIEQQCVEEDRTSGLCKDGQLYRPLSIDDGGPFYLVWPLQELPLLLYSQPQVHLGVVCRECASQPMRRAIRQILPFFLYAGLLISLCLSVWSIIAHRHL